MKTLWDTYRRKCYSLLNAITQRKKWDIENLTAIKEFEDTLRSSMMTMSSLSDIDMEREWSNLRNYWKIMFPPRVHPHHTAEYRRENYVSKAKYSDEERRLFQATRCKEMFTEWNNIPENRSKRSKYNILLKPATKEIKILISRMQGFDSDSEEYQELDEQLQEYVETYEEIRALIREGEI